MALGELKNVAQSRHILLFFQIMPIDRWHVIETPFVILFAITGTRLLANISVEAISVVSVKLISDERRKHQQALANSRYESNHHRMQTKISVVGLSNTVKLKMGNKASIQETIAPNGSGYGEKKRRKPW